MTGYSAQDYQAAGLEKLPPGVAWPRDPQSTLGKLIGAAADELARLDGRLGDLLDEADPSTALEMLSDWETTCGLPDGCASGLAGTLAERQQAVVDHLTLPRGQSRAYFIALAASLGRIITIDEFEAWRCGKARCGQTRLAPASIRHRWRIGGLETGARGRWRCGLARCGRTNLGWFDRDTELECRLGKEKPAQSTLIVSYALGSEAILLSDGAPLLAVDGEALRYAHTTPLERIAP